MEFVIVVTLIREEEEKIWYKKMGVFNSVVVYFFF